MADQFHVDLGKKPDIRRSNYVLWIFSKHELASLLINTVGLYGAWKLKTTSEREVKAGQFHPTARGRQATPAPLREFLADFDERTKPGRVLYHGMGRDKAGFEAMSRGGRDQVIGYDPYHPDPDLRRLPSGRFDEVFSIYTLNVVPARTGIEIIGELYDVLADGGKAIVAVRRDL